MLFSFTAKATEDEGDDSSTHMASVVALLAEKLKSADEAQPLSEGSKKLDKDTDKVVRATAVKVANAHFKSPSGLQALTSLRNDSGLKSQAAYQHTIVEAILRACISRQINFTPEELVIDP